MISSAVPFDTSLRWKHVQLGPTGNNAFQFCEQIIHRGLSTSQCHPGYALINVLNDWTVAALFHNGTNGYFFSRSYHCPPRIWRSIHERLPNFCAFLDHPVTWVSYPW